MAQSYNGRNCKVNFGPLTAGLIGGMGNWNMEGITVDQIDTSAFGTVYKTFEAGMQDGGQITFEGTFDATDANQNMLRTANTNGTHLTSLFFYVDNTSFYAPTTTNPASYIIITSYNVTADKADVIRTTFTGKVSGALHLISSGVL